MQPPTEAPDPAPLSRCDKLNAQLLRYRLRKYFETGHKERVRMMDLIAQSGPIFPPKGTPIRGPR